MFLYLIIGLCFITFYLFFYVIFGHIFKNKLVVGMRLGKIAKESARDRNDQLDQSLFVRVIRPLFDGVSRAILRATPKEIVAVFEKKVIMAGNPFNLSVKDWVNMQVLIVLGLPSVSAFIGYYTGMQVKSIALLILMGVILGILIPNLILSRKSGDRQKQITNSLPDVLDLLTVSVEAGLGFDAALSKVIEKMPGPLSVEFENVLQEIKVGKQKKDALKDMADKVAVQDLSTFICSIIQADQLGVSIGNVLRMQSEQMRQKRRQRAQEKAMKAPVKMLIPMVLFIFPTIFAVLLGPVVLRVMHTFMK